LTVGEKTGPVTGQPPPVSNETKAALAESAESSATGSHVPGRNAAPVAGEGDKKVKSEKERMNPICVQRVLQADPLLHS
jgi:valyl-tRNA synthetase